MSSSDSDVEEIESTSAVSDSPSAVQASLKKVLGPGFAAVKMDSRPVRKVLEWQKRSGQQVLFPRDIIRHDGKVDEVASRLHFHAEGNDAAAVAIKVRQCKKCFKVYPTDSGSFAKHIKEGNCEGPPEKRSKTGPLDQFLTSATNTEKPTSREKKEMAQAAARWVAINSRPLRIIEDDGLRKIVQVALEIGARHSGLQAADLLPCRQTVRAEMTRMSNDLLHSVGSRLPELMETNGGSIAIDYGKRFRDYLTVFVYFIDSWKLYRIHIAMFRSEHEVKDSAAVWEDVQDACERVGIRTPLLHRLFAVTDQGSNVCKAMRLHIGKSLVCFCHVLNTVSKRTFDPYKDVRFDFDLMEEEKELIKQAQKLLKAAKTFAKAVKGTSLGDRFETKIPLDCETRWLSRLKTLCALRGEGAALLELSTDQAALKHLPEKVTEAIKLLVSKWGDLDDLQQILVQFEEPVKKLQSKDVTIHEVLPMWMTLKNMFEQMIGMCPSATQNALARSAFKCMEKKEAEGVVTVYHRIATLLNPRRRKLKNLASQTQYNEAVSTLKELVASVTEEVPTVERPQTVSPFDDDDDALNVGTMSEVDRYLAASFPAVDNILDFWKGLSHPTLYPNLSKVAAMILCIPSSTADPERSFSDLRFLVSERREPLHATTVFDSLMIRSFDSFSFTSSE